jgi:hypothetical protein
MNTHEAQGSGGTGATGEARTAFDGSTGGASLGERRLVMGTRGLVLCAMLLSAVLGYVLSGSAGNRAMADEAVARGDAAMLTLDRGNGDDMLVVLDERTESLLFYAVANQKVLEFKTMERLPALFAAARRSGTPRP